ncbi:MucB/RseB C-terminal domain-containing protein [Marinomonas sp. C2222]|uniref:MucB/RseB C-terminal domain-containing protein n=2 Tax=Marinomonas sargassi TaxID=2984494 RepID=A0ABT2YVL3_9GAMM|nr:MucB/RseB C-terminal domain-containing protein [Marinomonas sargassi]
MRHFHFIFLLLFVALSLFSSLTAASDRALKPTSNESSERALLLLGSMAKSFSSLNYEGVFVHTDSTNMNSMRIRHGLLQDNVYESLEDLDGDKLEVIRINDTMVCVYSDATTANHTTPLNRPFQRFENVDSQRLLKGYQITLEPKLDRIAGRSVQIVKLTPKDAYRFGHEFWLDQENHFLLKHDLIKPSGQLLERTQFASVNFLPDLKIEDFTPKEGTYTKPIMETDRKYTKNVWHFDWLPEGFQLVWPEARVLNHSTSMLLLSDGITNVSVFVEPSMTSKNMSVFRTGATYAGETSFKVKDQRYLLTVVGEVPRITIEKLMTAFMPRH